MLLIALSAYGFSRIEYPTPARFYAVTAVAMIVLIVGAFIVIRINDAKSYVRPTRFRIDLIVLGVLLLAAIGATTIYRCEDNAQKALLLLVTLVMPLYEGVVYRGLMWHKLKKKLNDKMWAWLAMIGIVTVNQLFYTYNIYSIMVTAGDQLADPGNIVLGIICYGLVVNAIVGGVRVGVHNFTVPAVVHSIINLALMFLVVL